MKINVMMHCYKSNVLIFSLSISAQVKPWHLQWRKTAEIDRLTCSQGLIKLLCSLRMVPVLRASGFSLWKWSLCGSLVLRPPAVIVVGVQERTWMRADQRNSLLLFSNSFAKRVLKRLDWVESLLYWEPWWLWTATLSTSCVGSFFNTHAWCFNCLCWLIMQ